MNTQSGRSQLRPEHAERRNRKTFGVKRTTGHQEEQALDPIQNVRQTLQTF